MIWKITYYSEEVEKTVLKLPDGLLARYLKLAEMLETHGANLGDPHTTSLKDGLFELRVKSKEGIARVFYCTFIGKEIHMLHCFIKKSTRIPNREMKTAKERLKKASKKNKEKKQAKKKPAKKRGKKRKK